MATKETEHNNLPELIIDLSPRYDNGVAEDIHVLIRFTPSFGVGDAAKFPLFRSVPEIASTVGIQFCPGSLRVVDEEGDMDVSPTDASSPQIKAELWMAARKPAGVVTIAYVAKPRQVDFFTRNGPLLDFRKQDDGLLGAGFGFLAVPADTRKFSVQLTWNLADAPKGTTSAWTYGNSRDLTPDDVLATYYAVGRLSSEKTVLRHTLNEPSRFHFYWLGRPPFDMQDLVQDTKKLFELMADIFGDYTDPYSVFLRSHPYRGGSGTALQRSFMYSYTEDLDRTPLFRDQMAITIAHEMVHNWVLFDVDAISENWYAEGMADYLSLLLSFRAGTLDFDAVFERFNGMLSAYYTSPWVHKSKEEMTKLTWSCHTSQKFVYRRGVTFAILVNAIIRDATKSQFSIEDLAVDLVRQRTAGPVGFEQYRAWFNQKTGQDAQNLYETMSNGKDLMIPSPDSFPITSELTPKVALIRQDQYEWCLGFDESVGMKEHIVRNLDLNSRAYEAGIREGDSFEIWPELNEDKYKNELVFEITRDGDEKPRSIQYWPRTKTLVECWQYVKL